MVFVGDSCKGTGNAFTREDEGGDVEGRVAEAGHFLRLAAVGLEELEGGRAGPEHVVRDVAMEEVGDDFVDGAGRVLVGASG